LGTAAGLVGLPITLSALALVFALAFGVHDARLLWASGAALAVLVLGTLASLVYVSVADRARVWAVAGPAAAWLASAVLLMLAFEGPPR
jgi:hypothetical protein